MPGTSWSCFPCPELCLWQMRGSVPPPCVPARPCCLKEQGSDLCLVLEGRLRSFFNPGEERSSLGRCWEQLPGRLECLELGFSVGQPLGSGAWGFCFSS